MQSSFIYFWYFCFCCCFTIIDDDDTDDDDDDDDDYEDMVEEVNNDDPLVLSKEDAEFNNDNDGANDSFGLNYSGRIHTYSLCSHLQIDYFTISTTTKK